MNSSVGHLRHQYQVAPAKFAPSAGEPLGVGEHPHRGFETVTIAYQGEIEHRDSTGAGGKIVRLPRFTQG